MTRDDRLNIPDIHRQTADRVLTSLRTGRNGLSTSEAQRRLREFGPNELTRAKRESLVLLLLRSLTHFFAIILWIAAGLAFLAEASRPGEGMATLGAAIVSVVLINGLFSVWQTYKAERTLTALLQLLPPKAKVVRDGRTHLVDIGELVPGDLLVLAAGDNIPADCRLIDAYGVRVNLATVTGESAPQPRDAEPAIAESFTKSRNVVLAGTSLVSGDATAAVFSTGQRTEFGKIATLTQAARDVRPPLLLEIAFLSKAVAALATLLGATFFLIGRGLGLPFWENSIFAIGIIVANVPEGLLPTVTLSLALGAQRMARRHVLIRHLPAVETLGSATVICTDKTGTLTENSMSVGEVYLADGQLDQTTWSNEALLTNPARRFREVTLLCQTLRSTGDDPRQWLGDPTEIALVVFGRQICSGGLDRTRRDEIPFDADRRRLSTVYDTPEGPIVYTKGALEVILPLCTRFEMATGPAQLSTDVRQRIIDAETAMADRGLRVLALAYKPLSESLIPEEIESNLVFVGLAGLRDPPRPGVTEAIRKAREAGIKLIMVTGDHPHTSVALARTIGLITLPSALVVSGEQLQGMTDTELQLALNGQEIIFARTTADQKLRIVRALRAKGEVVAVTGDGVNDAPALKEADIGIAMGQTGSDVAREAADMVLLQDNFVNIIDAIEEGRTVFENIRKFMTYILASNIPEVVPYLAFALFRIPLPLTIIQILAVDLGTDMLPALGLGAERPSADIMNRPPRPRSERLVTPGLVVRAYLFLGPIEAFAAMAVFFFVLYHGGWVWGAELAAHELLYREATTACLTAIVAMQVVNVFLCRSDRKSSFALGWLNNRLVLWGVAAEIALILLIVYTDIGNSLFGTAPIAAAVWIFIAPFAAAMLIAEESRKAIARRLFPQENERRAPG